MHLSNFAFKNYVPDLGVVDHLAHVHKMPGSMAFLIFCLFDWFFLPHLLLPCSCRHALAAMLLHPVYLQGYYS